MGLVDYTDSEDDGSPTGPAAKKRKLPTVTLPPLPASFLDRYSSTVRTGTQDDPSMHGGRKRETPHVPGNWPAHVYLEWHPQPSEGKVLSELVSCVSSPDETDKTSASRSQAVHSLLENDLGVSLPLHVSLSRPLLLTTPQKDKFLDEVKAAVSDSGVASFAVRPADVTWHSNETRTRYFLVLRLQETPRNQLKSLLRACNIVAHAFGRPLLYAEPGCPEHVDTDAFHISIAWTLDPSRTALTPGEASAVGESKTQAVNIPGELVANLSRISISFPHLKVRIGQDVCVVPLRSDRFPVGNDDDGDQIPNQFTS